MFCPFWKVQAGKQKTAFPLQLFCMKGTAYSPVPFQYCTDTSEFVQHSKNLLQDDNFRQLIHSSDFLMQKQIYSLPAMPCSLLGGSCSVALCPAVMEGVSLYRDSLVKSWGWTLFADTQYQGSGEGWSFHSLQQGWTLSSQETKLLFHSGCCCSTGEQDWSHCSVMQAANTGSWSSLLRKQCIMRPQGKCLSKG